MEVTTEAVASVTRTRFSGDGYRHIAERWDEPLSGDGARIRGCRFNSPDSFPVLYLCTTRLCAAAELRRLGERQVIGVAGLLPRLLYRYEVSLDQVLDLTTQATLEHLGVTLEQVTAADTSLPRQIGETAHSLGVQAIRAPSATGVDDVLAVFPDLLGSGRIIPHLVKRWATEADL